MPKMIPHRLMERFADHPLIKELERTAGDGSSRQLGSSVDVECESFFIIPLFMKTHPLFLLLIANNLFDFAAEDNKIYLPVNAFQAYMIGKSVYAEHSIESYWRGILKLCDDAANSFKGKKIDVDDITKLAVYAANLQKQLRAGLETAKLHAGPPYTDADWQRDRPLERWTGAVGPV